MDVGQITPRFLESMHHQPMKWHVALGELCDNAFDAGAQQIQIKFGPKRKLEVIDDGAGCANLERMLTLGAHMRQRTTSLGRYGVGLKEAACWLWGELYIASSHRGTLREAVVNWPRLAKQDHWNIPDPVESPATALSGTTLMFSDVTRQFPDYKSLAAELGYTFAPALWNGRQIKLLSARKPAIVCPGWALPDLEDVVAGQFTLNGKGVKLTAGIVAAGSANDRPGFSVCHGHRILLNTAFGAKGHSVSRIAGKLELDSEWGLAKNKTDIVDADQDQLEAAVFDLCGEIITRSAHQAEVLRNSELETKVSDQLRQIIGQSRDAKAKRKSPKNQSGSVQPTGSGKRHNRAKNTQPGSTLLSKCDIGQIRMEWQPRSDGVIGSVDLPGNVVYLNADHARMSHHRDNQNADALVDSCMALLAFEHIDLEQREKLVFGREYGGFVECWSDVLKSQQELEAATAAAT